MRGPGQNPGNMRRYGTLPHGGGRGPAPSGLAALGGPRPPVRRPLRGRRTSAVCSRVFAPSGPLALAPVTVGGPCSVPSGASAPPARGAGGRGPGRSPSRPPASACRRGARPSLGRRGAPRPPRRGPWWGRLGRPRAGGLGLPCGALRAPCSVALGPLRARPCLWPGSGLGRAPPSPARRLRAAASGLAPPRRGPWSARPLRGRFVWRSRPPALLALPRRCGVAVVPSPRRLGVGAPCRQRSDLPPLLACSPHVLHINEASTYPAPAPEKVEQNIFYFVQFSPLTFAPLPGGSNAEDDLNKIPVVVQFFPTGPLLPLPTPSVDSARYTPPVR